MDELFRGLSPPYTTIVADPPWNYNASVKELRSGGRGGQAEHQYPTMSNEEIRDLPVRDLVGKQAHLYLWVTNPRMFGGRSDRVNPRDIVEAWGFEFKTMLTWVKPGSGGMGWYFRGQTEHVVFASRGMLGIPSDKRERNVIEAKRGRHSEKPAAFFDLVERVSPGPYLEMFARQQRPGWHSWGNEVLSGGLVEEIEVVPDGPVLEPAEPEDPAQMTFDEPNTAEKRARDTVVAMVNLD